MARSRLGRGSTILLTLVVPLLALVTVVVTLNVTDDSNSSAASGHAGNTADRAGTAISIKNFRYDPNPITVKVGAVVTVTNDDGTVHTLTADDKTFDTGQLDGGARAAITITKAGTYKYFCDIHNYMTGTIEAR